MFVLINMETMTVLAKHPDFAVLCELGVIMCPDDQYVMPLSPACFRVFDDEQIQLLYIMLTNNFNGCLYDRDVINVILSDYLNGVDENVLDHNQVSKQAAVCIAGGFEGYCSFAPGKNEPSFDEGSWTAITCTANAEREAGLSDGSISTVPRAATQLEFWPRRERGSE